jgi:hypothetical protein
MEITITDIVFNYIEFFFSKEDLKTMFKIKPLSQHVWLEAVHGLYSTDPNESKSDDEKVFHYNIMHTTAYKDIIECLENIKKIVIDSAKAIANIPTSAPTTPTLATDATSSIIATNKIKKEEDIKKEYDKINILFNDLYYYEETYVHAHYIFNDIRNTGMKLKGGGIKNIKDIKDMTLEEFKDVIREKIRELGL